MANLTPMQMNAGSGLLQNSGLSVSSNLTDAISDYTSIAPISIITYCLNNASAKVSGTTLANLYDLGDGVFPGLTNIVPNTDQSVVGQGALTTLITAHASDLFGTDYGVFAQHLASASGFTALSNEFITSALNADTTFEMNTDINNLLTGAITDTNLALRTFALDLLNLGNIIDYNDLRNFGNPLAFVRVYYRQAGGLPVLEKYLREEGINTAGLTNAISLNDTGSLINYRVDELGTKGLTSYPDGINPEVTASTTTKKGLGQAVWTALGKIKDDDLTSMMNILDADIAGLESAQDFMDPKKLFPNSYESLKSFTAKGKKTFMYNNQAFNDSLAGLGEDLYVMVPSYIADSNKALSNSLQQIKDVFNITSQQLSQVTDKLETTKGLDIINALTKPVPDTTIDFYRNQYGIGSGANGEFLVTDVIGSVAGFTHTTELEILKTQIGGLADAGHLDNIENLYETMKNLFDNASGYYTIVQNFPITDPPTYTETWHIPSGRYGLSPASYGSRSAAVDVVITACNTELASLASSWSTQASLSTNSIENMSNQVRLEKLNMPKAGIVPADTQTGVKTSVLGLVTNLHDYGRDDSLGGTAWILENMAADNFYGESLIAALREGRNIYRLNDASIGNALEIVSNTRTSEKATLIDSEFSVDEAKSNIDL